MSQIFIQPDRLFLLAADGRPFFALFKLENGATIVLAELQTISQIE